MNAQEAKLEMKLQYDNLHAAMELGLHEDIVKQHREKWHDAIAQYNNILYQR